MIDEGLDQRQSPNVLAGVFAALRIGPSGVNDAIAALPDAKRVRGNAGQPRHRADTEHFFRGEICPLGRGGGHVDKVGLVSVLSNFYLRITGRKGNLDQNDEFLSNFSVALPVSSMFS